jgi:hypothetical protein
MLDMTTTMMDIPCGAMVPLLLDLSNLTIFLPERKGKA